MSLLNAVRRAENTPVDYKFIHSVSKPLCPSQRMVQHETLPEKPSLEDVFKGKDAVCILFRVLHHSIPTAIAHWCCLFKGKNRKITFFDSLALNLKGIYRLTHESPKLLYALRNTKYERSHRPLQKLIARQKYCGAAVAVRLRFYKTKSNREFESFILNHDRGNPGHTLCTLCYFHYEDQHEYEISEDM